MRIVLAISSLGPGGAERVMSLLAGALVARNHEVWLVTLAERGNDFFPLDSRVHRIGLGLTRDSPSALHGLRANLQRIWALRRVVSSLEPHAVLSFVTSTNVLTILACMRLPVRIIVSERVDPAAHRERIWSNLRSLFYVFADAVVVQTESIAAWFRKKLRNRTRIVTIPNPVVAPPEVEGCDDEIGPFLLAAGRFTHQKGFDLLIRAFSEATRERTELSLVIAGDGPEAQPLRELAARLGLGARVSFPGRVRELSRLLRSAVAFIVPSRYEGFPNVLLEALAAGIPCVATDCPGATREILGDGAYGLLVPPEDLRALTEAINRITTDSELHRRFSQAGAAAIERYGLERIVVEWERVLAGSVDNSRE
jgi:GalNAc-alpha-(1->4)-GalNAc-alpha-(1->3)-diNAcBac-PP-undecaprenol alpha-1,4-N-acetyl-D-galactosaminyltransferase